MPPTSSLRCADVADVLDAFALGALDASEEREIERHVARCPTCRAQLDRTDETIGLLGLAVEPVPPPATLRARLLDEMATGRRRAEPAGPVIVPLPAAAPRSNVVALPRLAAIGLALVASLLLAAVVITGVLLDRALGERDDARAAQRQLAYYVRGDSAVAALVPATEATPEATPAAAEQPTGKLYFAPGRPGCLVVVAGLVPTSENRHYRVWVGHKGERMRVGELQVDENGTGTMVVWPPDEMPEYDTVGITLAPSGDQESQDLLVAAVPAGDWAWPDSDTQQNGN